MNREKISLSLSPPFSGERNEQVLLQVFKEETLPLSLSPMSCAVSPPWFTCSATASLDSLHIFLSTHFALCLIHSLLLEVSASNEK